MAQVEQVLVVPRLVVEEVGMFHGLVFDVDSYLEKFFAADVPGFMPRPDAEQDPSHKQLIPYVLIRCGEKYLTYVRGKRAGETRLQVKPFMDTVQRGVFATRAPVRPSRLGMSVVQLVSVEGSRITVRGIDVLDGTPLLDIKPYIEQFDHPAESRSGWMQAKQDQISRKRSDQRFT